MNYPFWHNTMNNRSSKIHKLRQELRSLRQQFEGASEMERRPLVELRRTIRKKLMTLSRAEWQRSRKKEKSIRQAAFLANPFGFIKQQLGKKCSGQLACSKAEVDHHLKETYSNEHGEQYLDPCKALIKPPAPALESEEHGWKEIQEVVKRPREVPYKVYNNCPKLFNMLWKMMKVIWRRGKVADHWRQAEGVYPK